MRRVVAVAGALSLGVVLVGCGHSARPRVEPDLAGRPTWGGCAERATQVSDYTVDAQGAETRAAAIAPYRTDGDHVVLRDGRSHRAAAWLLVDEHDVIHTSLELMRGADGWLVSVVEKCAG